MTSDLPLNGSIISLYQVQNGRTKEQYIVGGADDGTVAFWQLQYVSFFRDSIIRNEISSKLFETVCALDTLSRTIMQYCSVR
jgi:hypothetical protein